MTHIGESQNGQYRRKFQFQKLKSCNDFTSLLQNNSFFSKKNNFVAKSSKNFNLKFLYFMYLDILRGLIDSDGCITWTWSRERTFIPSITVTQKTNRRMLRVLKEHFQGYVCANGNWVVKNMKNIQGFFRQCLYLDSESWETCFLYSSRRLDAHLLNVAMVYCLTKFHKTQQGTAVLIRFRLFLHHGSTTAEAMTPTELCARQQVSQNTYQAMDQTTRNFVARAMREVRQNKIEVETILRSGVFSETNCISPYQVVGFFLGDGGIHVVWGTQIMTTTLNFTGDRRSTYALEFYCWSLLRDGRYRKAWKSKVRDVSRLLIHGVENFVNHICPFFETYEVPDCEKKEILNTILETAVFLKTLKEKETWSNQDFEELLGIVQRTWDLNPSGPARKFASPEIYVAHVREKYNRNGFRIG